jgi:hypothetical protein
VDATVAIVSAGLPWDEALSGAAAGVALGVIDGETADPRMVRWKAILAGYPYPVVARTVTTVAVGQVPQGLAEEARARVAAITQTGGAADLGLVRARSDDGDTWVMLVGVRRGEIGRIPREIAVGEGISLPPGDWTVADPDGGVSVVHDRLAPGFAGEWLLRWDVDGQPVATFPVYVDMATPKAPPFALPLPQGDTPEGQARRAVAGARAHYELPLLEPDTALDSVARARLRTLVEGGTLPEVTHQLHAAGFVNVPVAGASCRAATVGECLDAVWWSPADRGVFTGDAANIGVAASVADGQVALIIVTAG